MTASRSERAAASGPLTAEGFAEALAVSRETQARFETWRALLATWNARVNLVAASTLDDFWRRHALDCAQLADLAGPEARSWVDLGAGAGFPGLAVALVRADRGWPCDVRLVESNGKKAAFLREAVRATGAPAVVLAQRAEALAPVPADVVTARAFAPLPRLIASAERVWGPRTSGLFLKGRRVEAEIDSLKAAYEAVEVTVSPSRSDPDGRIVEVRLAGEHPG